MIRGVSHSVLNELYVTCETEARTRAAVIGMFLHGKDRYPVDTALPEAFALVNECIEAQFSSGEVLETSLALDLTDPRDAGMRKLFPALALKFTLRMQLKISGTESFTDAIKHGSFPPSALLEHGADVWGFWIFKKPAVLTFGECKDITRCFLEKIVPENVKIDGSADLWNMRFPVSVSDLCYVAPDALRYELQAFTEKNSKAVQPLETYTAAELANMKISPPPFTVDGLLPAGLTIFAAPPKTGKSWACIDLCAAVASGKPFWGRSTRKGSVLYMDLESRAWRLKSRFPQAGIEQPKDLYIAHDADMLGDGFIEQVQQWAVSVPDPRLIVVDTFARVKPGKGSRMDAYMQDTHILKPLQAFAVEKKIAVVIVTHLKKRNSAATYDDDPFERITGSNGQFAVADSSWLLIGSRRAGMEHPNEYEFRATGRDFQDVSIQTVFKDCRWIPLGDTAELMEQRRKESFATNPLIRLIVRKVDESIGGEWSATAAEMMTETQRIFGVTPDEASTPTGLGIFLKKNAGDLFNDFRIIHTQPRNPTKYGRLHTFKKALGGNEYD